MSTRFEKFLGAVNLALYFLLFSVLLTASNPLPEVEADRLSDYTRGLEFDFTSWIANASWIKLQQASLGSPYYMTHEKRKEIVVAYFHNMEDVLLAEWELEQIYTDPQIDDPEAASAELHQRLDALYAEQNRLAPFAESVLEEEVSAALAEAGLTTGGQPIPRPLYHITPLPVALVISPRDTIRQDKNIMLKVDFPIDERDALEQKIFNELNLSALVVPVGGVGVYPTMGMRSTNLPWTLDTIAHEWTHNYLDWHPLGWNYGTSPELRTINETVASIVGGEISQMVLEKEYPELLAAERSRVRLISASQPILDPDPPPFDYRAEMHETRVHTDELLAAGKIEEAEAYMEERRQFMWENGYAIRKLNQAYFAFYGAYADVPGGAAGEDPVGPAVRKLRAQSDSLADFVHTIMWVDSFDELLALLDE